MCFFLLLFQVLKKISGYIQEQNEKIFAPRGLLLTDPIERGMRVVSFQVPRTAERLKKNAFRHFRQNWEMSMCVLWVIFHLWAVCYLDRFISFRHIQGNVATSASVMLKCDSLFMLFHQA